MKKTVAFFTLGCKVNFCETETLQVLFEEGGYRIVEFSEPADVYVVNTCTVTGQSDHKSRKALRRARKMSERATIVATGCYAQGKPQQLKELGLADLIIGNKERQALPQIIESLNKEAPLSLVFPHSAQDGFELLPAAHSQARARGFLKIQDGCNQYCTYCIIPYVRGPLRSMPPAEVIKRVRALVRAGCSEVVLTGIHLGLYGAGQNITLAELLQRLEKVSGLLRLRLSSVEPSDVTPELIKTIINSKIICPHLHMPLQSGADEILKKMNRPYGAQEYLYLAKLLQQEIPLLALSTDYIVGFPGETGAHHRYSLEMAEEIGFSHLHVFKYSPRPGTPAATMAGQVESEVKDKRSHELITLGQSLAKKYQGQFCSTLQPILIEKVVPYHYGEGFTPHYIRARVKCTGQGKKWRGKIITARLTENTGPYMTAKLSGGRGC